MVEDPDDSDLADLYTALAEAREDVRILYRGRIKAGTAIQPWKIDVADEVGLMLADVNFHEVLSGLG